MLTNKNPIEISHGVFAESDTADLTDIFLRYLPGRKFLDLGSGLGKVVDYALKFTPDAWGVEIEPWLVENSLAPKQIITGDFFTFDWSAYNVLYLYLISNYKEDDLVKNILQNFHGTFICYDKDVQTKWKNDIYELASASLQIETFAKGKIYHLK